MMDNFGYLLAANVAMWLGVGGYLVYMLKVTKGIEKRIAQMEALRDERG